MANPNTRETLKQYALRNLGKPVIEINASDEQLDFPILYASGRDGWCVKELSDNREGVGPLLDLVIKHVKAPSVKRNEPFAMLVTLLDSDDYVGRCLIGKVYQGTAKVNSSVKAIDLNGNLVESGRLTKLYKFEEMKRTPVDIVNCGDIICIAGLTKASVADTICDISYQNPLKTTPIDPPTMSITISINDSPLSGLEGKKLTSTLIRERLLAEAETNVAISFSENANKDSFVISGRGELQLGVLIETMRREGFELTVSRPQVLFKKDDQGRITEPIEEVTIDVDEEYSNSIVDSMIKRKAEMIDMNTSEKNKTRIIFNAPSRGLIGYQNKFLTDTKGTGVLNRIFKSYEQFKGEINGRKNGVLIANVKNPIHISVLRRLFFKPSILKDVRRLRKFEKTGVHFATKRNLKKWLKNLGVNNIRVITVPDRRYIKVSRVFNGIFDFLFASNLIVIGKKI